jgi:glycosyltransferase involved in cell wall biosynthesis
VRIAWFGPAPTSHGGVPFASGQILRGLAGAGAQVDAFIATGPDALPDLGDVAGLRVLEEPMQWSWDRWYSRRGVLTVPSAQFARARAQRRLLSRLVVEHAENPYDVIHQFSQFETPWSSRSDSGLPPIVVHPEVHAAGELRWHRAETALARRCEPRSKRLAVRANLIARTVIQRRSSHRARGIVSPSAVFARHLASDYGLPAGRFRVVPNPIDTDRFAPATRARKPGEPIRLLFVSRISVRKGVEDVVALTHRLADLAGHVHIHVVGEHALFSDYRPLLKDLNSEIGTYEGGRSGEELPSIYRGADGLIQPSKYEPFALTVGEGLASGLVVAASNEVGATEEVDKSVCIRFHAGDLNGFEASVRALVARIERDDGRLAKRAREEATRLFSTEAVGSRLLAALRELAADAR